MVKDLNVPDKYICVERLLECLLGNVSLLTLEKY
jgi:hypothetical protein